MTIEEGLPREPPSLHLVKGMKLPTGPLIQLPISIREKDADSSPPAGGGDELADYFSFIILHHKRCETLPGEKVRLFSPVFPQVGVGLESAFCVLTFNPSHQTQLSLK
jgi:hypothetical protein